MGGGPKAPYTGARLKGRRMEFSACEPRACKGIGAFSAMCETRRRCAMWAQRGRREAADTGWAVRRARQRGEEKALRGRRSKGG